MITEGHDALDDISVKGLLAQLNGSLALGSQAVTCYKAEPMGAGAYQIVQFSKPGRSNVGKFDGKKEEDNDNEKGPRSKAPSSVTFGTKEDPRLMKYAKETFEGYEQLRNEATSLIEQMKAGNFSGGSGSHGIGQGIFELRSRNGVRVYFRNIGDAVAILGYSKKANQPEVISKLFALYGK